MSEESLKHYKETVCGTRLHVFGSRSPHWVRKIHRGQKGEIKRGWVSQHLGGDGENNKSQNCHRTYLHWRGEISYGLTREKKGIRRELKLGRGGGSRSC